MSCVRTHFWTFANRFPSGCFCPIRYGTKGCMPAVLKSTEGSFSGTSEAEGIILCPLFSKNFKNLDLISFDCILESDYTLFFLFHHSSTQTYIPIVYDNRLSRGNQSGFFKNDLRRIFASNFYFT